MANCRRRLPCSACRAAQQACRWSSEEDRIQESEVCLRCQRLDKTCSGPSTAPPRRRKAAAQYSKEVINLGPTSSTHAMGEMVMTAALTYELISTYREHIRTLTDVDPELEPFRQNLLRWDFMMAGPCKMNELQVLILMISGAKLSSHSAITRTSTTLDLSTNLVGAELWNPNRPRPPNIHLNGLAREDAVRALSAKIVPLLERLHENLSSDKLVENILNTWTALNQLSRGLLDIDERCAMMRGMMANFNAFIGADAEVRERSDGILAMILSRQPSFTYLSYLEEDANGTMSGFTIPPELYKKFACSSSIQPLRNLASDQLRLLCADPVASTLHLLLRDLRDPPIAYLKRLIEELAVNPSPLSTRLPTVLHTVDSLQSFFLTQFSLVTNECSRHRPQDSSKLPRGAKRALDTLFGIETSLVVCTWTLHREMVKSSLSLEPLGMRIDTTLLQLIAHATILKESCTTEYAMYTLTTLVAQTLDFIQGPRLTEWVASFPTSANQLLEILDYASFSHACASRLVIHFREILGLPNLFARSSRLETENQPQLVPTKRPQHKVAAKLVSGVLGNLGE